MFRLSKLLSYCQPHLCSVLHQVRVYVLNPHKCLSIGHYQDRLENIISQASYFLDVIHVVLQNLHALGEQTGNFSPAGESSPFLSTEKND